MLGTLDVDKSQYLKQSVGPLVQAYDCIKHENTGNFPYMLLDIPFGLNPNNNSDFSYTEYITDLQGKNREAFVIVHKSRDKATSWQVNIMI